MRKEKIISQLKPKLAISASLLSVICAQAFAIPLMPGKIVHPILYAPVTTHLVPTGLTPAQVKIAYGFGNILSQGGGQTIAIVDAYDHPRIEQDLAVFNQKFNLPPCTTQNGLFKKVYASGTKPDTNADWAGEISLDVEWAHAIAPKARIMLVEAASSNPQDLYTAVTVAVQNGANVVSLSWGSPEYAYQTHFDTYLNVPNVTIVASSGDAGAGTMFPAASPYVLSVGGTSLTLDAMGDYVEETSWDGSSGGVSTVEAIPDYQASFGIPASNNMRGVPDVAYNADPNTGFSVYNSIPGEGGAGWQIVGGTSAGAPQWAALVAVANTATRSVLGNRFSKLVYTAASPGSGIYASLFHDVTLGTNGQCGYFCSAMPGYDYVTGLGTPKVEALIRELRAIHSQPDLLS